MKHTIFLSIVLIFVIIGCKSKNTSHTHSHLGNTTHHSHASTNYFEAYNLSDENYGTKTIVSIKNNMRIMETNALPNHKTGDFPRKGNPNTISAQNRTYTIPLNPAYTGKPTWIREPGVALNGVKFEPGTAEVVVCETGENYRVEAFQDLIDLGLDFNHAHVQPTGAYHYHGTPTSVIEKFDTGKDLVHVGFAHDGFPMYYSKSGKYKSSYKLLDGTREGEDCVYENPMQTLNVAVGGHHDGTYGSDFEFVAGSGDLDECNGITINGEYLYLVTNEFPYISRCLMGKVVTEERKGPPRNQRERLSLDDLFKRMDENKDEKLSKDEVKGPLANEFTEFDTNNDGFITIVELEKSAKNRPRRKN
ncbi:YHYH protein [Polaribacter sp.]|uniref:YHYH protein n=1 Tax=Polaribacter sp. TaxID=1920175 RepID=UPI003EFB20CA